MKAISCEHWSDCGIVGGGCCAISKHGDQPSVEVCLLTCNFNDKELVPVFTGKFITLPKSQKRSRGLGDTVKKVINKITGSKVKPCAGCKKRQEALNKLLPYKQKDGK